MKLAWLGFAMFAVQAFCLSFPEGQPCTLTCSSADNAYVYCAQKGCCGFVHVDVTTPAGPISENGTGKLSAAAISIQSPETTLSAQAGTDAYRGTLTITSSGAEEATAVTVSCPLLSEQ